MEAGEGRRRVVQYFVDCRGVRWLAVEGTRNLLLLAWARAVDIGYHRVVVGSGCFSGSTRSGRRRTCWMCLGSRAEEVGRLTPSFEQLLQ